LVRDSIFRANTAEMTLSQWDRVRDGEERNIFHFQNRADVVFNTALIYELPVLKMRALPLLESIREESPAFSEAWRLRQFLEPFEELDDENVPANSILREFIGP
jgi:uridine kinase